MSALRQSGLFRITAENEDLVRAIFVERTVELDVPEDIRTNPDYDFEVSAEVLKDLLEKKDKEKGMSNMGYGELQGLFKNMAAFSKH